MKNLVLGLFVMLSSLVFGQDTDEESVYYELYWIKSITYQDNTVEKVRFIEYEPTSEYFKEENITKWDTVGVLSFISGQVIDSLNKLRVKKGLPAIINDGTYTEDEYGYTEECVFDYYGRGQIPLMVTDFDYDMGECTCVNEIIAEITSHKEIMRRLLSKRNKVLNVCIVLDKKTNIFSTYIQVKRVFTLGYFIG